MIKEAIPCMLLINDIHISKDNIPEFKINWNEALSICKQKKIQIMIVGGDMFQSRSAQTLDVLLAVNDAIIDAQISDIKVYLANGNHDKINQEATKGYCHVYGMHPNVCVIDDYITLVEEEWNFSLHIIPYFPERGSFQDKLNIITSTFLSKKGLNYLYIHQGINGALATASENELPTHIFKDFDKVFVGHYHNRFVIPDTVIEYVGASRQHNFGEDEEKGYTVLFNEGSHVFIKNEANIRYKTLNVNVEKVNINLLDQIYEMNACGRTKIKVKIHGTSSQSQLIDKSKLIEAGANKVEVITDDLDITDVASSSLFEKFDSHKIQENYKNFCREKNIDDVALGLSYLSKIGIHVETK